MLLTHTNEITILYIRLQFVEAWIYRFPEGNGIAYLPGHVLEHVMFCCN